ncbi:kif5 [Symbiodinium necroappetens]|uniref:Kif5 protein n=1 Tax=Symbiodinium necroappetens TaxID=1628268 RepID=A0A812NSF8_9DINO|nr:kif5 [Symbiodinium necroappetens]
MAHNWFADVTDVFNPASLPARICQASLSSRFQVPQDCGCRAMASRLSCLVVAITALAAVFSLYSLLPDSETFVAPCRTQYSGRCVSKALQAQRDRRPTDLDEQYGKPPPTETPQFATSNVIFNVASVFALLLLACLPCLQAAATAGLGFFSPDSWASRICAWGYEKIDEMMLGSIVYKEKMQDLLRPNSEMLRVKELPQRGLFVDGLSREYVTCASDVMAVIRAGLRTRAVGRTRCNNYSSRSHVVFVLHVEQQSLQGEERLGKLTLVDLAGSEKVSKNECVGETFEEAKKINWSLSALGKVIDALAEQRSHVPYRDSKLTRVLQESFKQVTTAENLSTCPKLTPAAPCAFLMGLTQDRGFNRSRGEEAEMSRGQPASSSSYWTCQCRVTHNYFVKSVGKHFMYRGDDVEFYRQHGDEPCPWVRFIIDSEVADVLADLRRQREATKGQEEQRRAKTVLAPDRTMQRVDKIAQHYTRLHPEVYVLNAPAFLDPGFLKVVQGLRVSGPAAASIAGLKSEGLLEELRPGIWSFPVFTTAFCDAFESELGHFRASGLPRSAPNTMNRHGVIMSELGFEELLDPLVFEHVNVLASQTLGFVAWLTLFAVRCTPTQGRLLPAFTEFLDSYRGFTVLYEATQDGDKGLAMHYDNAEVTLNVNIGGTWQGHVAYYGLATSKEESPPFEVSLRKGYGIFHAGLELHKVNYTYSPEQLLVLVGKLHKQLLGSLAAVLGKVAGDDTSDTVVPEAPTHDADKAGALQVPSSGKSFFIPEEAFGLPCSKDVLQKTCFFRPVGIELSEPDLTQAVPGAQKEDDEEEDVEAMSWHLYDEVFKPFALSAQKAMGAMEDALLAQEQALAEVRLRHAQREDAGHDRPTPSYSSSRPGLEEESREANLLSERFRALRHAVESRSLRWRLQVEKHRAEQLVIELQMRDKFQKELEESLAEARTRIAEAEELSAARAKASTASSGTGNTPAPRSPPGSSGGNSAASRREKPRIVRPVPRTRNTRGSPTRSKTMSLDVPKEVLSPLVSPNASRIPTPSARAEDVLWVAGTGDTGGEASGSSTLESSCETGALASTSVDAKAQGASMDVDVRASMPGEALQTDLKQQALLERRSSKLRDLMGELQSKDLQISALRHQIRIKDALLGCLQDEERFRFETLDSELEALLEKAKGSAISLDGDLDTRADCSNRCGDTSASGTEPPVTTRLLRCAPPHASRRAVTVKVESMAMLVPRPGPKSGSRPMRRPNGPCSTKVSQAGPRNRTSRTSSRPRQLQAPSSTPRTELQEASREDAAARAEDLAAKSRNEALQAEVAGLREELREADKHIKVASLQATAVNAELRDRRQRHQQWIRRMQEEATKLRRESQRLDRSFHQAGVEGPCALQSSPTRGPRCCFVHESFLMYGLVRSRLTEDGLLVSDVEDHTSFMSLGAGVGAAAGGMGAFMLCASKCPGGIGGSLGGMLGAMNPMNLMPFGSEKEEKEADEVKEPEAKMQKQLNYIEKELCNMNCKMAGLMGAAAGGAAGHVVEKKLKEKSEAEAAADQEAEAEQAPPPAAPAPAPYKGGGKGYPPPPPPGYYRHPPPPYRRPPPYYQGAREGADELSEQQNERGERRIAEFARTQPETAEEKLRLLEANCERLQLENERLERELSAGQTELSYVRDVVANAGGPGPHRVPSLQSMAAPTALVAAPAPPKGTVKPISPDVQEPPRRKHGELRLPMNAIINRARPPPEASRKRKMEMDQGFVEVDFQPGEFPMGLVVDWSMALPVLSGVVPGSAYLLD